MEHSHLTGQNEHCCGEDHDHDADHGDEHAHENGHGHGQPLDHGHGVPHATDQCCDGDHAEHSHGHGHGGGAEGDVGGHGHGHEHEQCSDGHHGAVVDVPPSRCQHDHDHSHGHVPDIPGLSNETVLLGAFLSFMLFVVFEVIAGLQAQSLSLIGDAASMAVDAMTYLANFLAVRAMRIRGTRGGGALSTTEVLIYEVLPPSISMTVLLGVTVFILSDAVETLTDGDAERGSTEEEVSRGMTMLIFGGINLAVDVVNVVFFIKREHQSSAGGGSALSVLCLGGEPVDGSGELNMASAWTHVFADTLRSVTVMISGTVAVMGAASADRADAVGALVVSAMVLVVVGPVSRELRGKLRKAGVCARRGDQQSLIGGDNSDPSQINPLSEGVASY